MAITRINVGNIANDGTGDDLRQAFVKVNNNFSELDARVVPQNNAENLGTGEGVYYAKENNTLQFRSLLAGADVSLTANGNSITISSNSVLYVKTDGSTLSLTGEGKQFGIKGGQNITTSLSGDNINVALDGTDLIFQDKNPVLGDALDANGFNINDINSLNAVNITATSITGALTGTVNGYDVADMGRIINGVDYGLLSDNVLSMIQIMFLNTPVDYGTITAPGSLVSDYGSI